MAEGVTVGLALGSRLVVGPSLGTPDGVLLGFPLGMGLSVGYADGKLEGAVLGAMLSMKYPSSFPPPRISSYESPRYLTFFKVGIVDSSRRALEIIAFSKAS
jgi:hypothetical protein